MNESITKQMQVPYRKRGNVTAAQWEQYRRVLPVGERPSKHRKGGLQQILNGEGTPYHVR